MFNQLYQQLSTFKSEVDTRKETCLHAIEVISGSYKQSAAKPLIDAEEMAYKKGVDSFRVAFAQIINSTIDEYEDFITAENAPIDIDSVRALQTLFHVETIYSDRERDSIIAQYDTCALSHRLLAEHFGFPVNTLENQIAVLEKVRTDLLYMANCYDGELTTENVSAEGASMLRIFSAENFTEYLDEFNNDNPFVNSVKVVSHYAVLSEEQTAAIEELFKSCSTIEDFKERADGLALIPGMGELLGKSNYSRYVGGGDTLNAVESFLDSIPVERSYLIRGFIRNLIALGYEDAVKKSKYAGMMDEQ
jgi:hypothetical protein